MNFKDATKVCEIIHQMRENDRPRSRNRARINQVFNGDPPYTQDEAEKNKIHTNVNFLEATNIAHNARSMFDTAFINGGDHFTITLDYGPVHKRQEWGSILTKEINRTLRRNLHYIEQQKQKFAQVVLHGVGPAMWPSKKVWCPNMLGIDDLLVPSKTFRGFTNLDHFAVHHRMTAAELYQRTHPVNGNPDPGWNLPLVKKVLAALSKAEPGPQNEDNYLFPEKLQEDYKANSGFYASDTTPMVSTWDVYFLDPSSPVKGWKRRMVLSETDLPSGLDKVNTKEFLFNPGDRPYAEKLEMILATQFADGNNVSPFRYHSIRSLGFLLYSVSHLANRLRCRMTDTTFREMMMLFRNIPDGDKERTQLIDLYDMGVIPDGWNFVTAQERYQVNQDLVMSSLAQMRQLMAENSARYTNELNDGTGKERTATEVMAQANAANALVGAMLGMAYVYEEFQDREICRRFCLVGTGNEEIERFQTRCLQAGVPREVFNVDAWEVNRNKTLGSGNKTLQVAMADRLQAIRPQLDPAAQRAVDRIFVQANTDDPTLAEELVPMSDRPVSSSQEKASLAWGTLIDGKPVVLGGEINRIEYIEVLLGLLQSELDTVQQTPEPPSLRRIIGLSNVIEHISGQVQTLENDENEKQRIKVYSDLLARAGNMVKAMAEQFAQQQGEAGGGIPPEAQAKIQAMLLQAESKARIAEENAAQKRSHRELSFQQDQLRKDKKLRAEIAAKDATTQAEIIRTNSQQALKPTTPTK